MTEDATPGPGGDPPLPGLTGGLLDDPTLLRLFADLDACAEVHEILLKSGARDRVQGPSRVSLAEAREALRSGAVRGAQIRYRYDGAEWCDTLLAGPEGVRLVRLQQE